MTKEMLDQKYRGVQIGENDCLLRKLDGASGTKDERHFEFSDELAPGATVKGEIWVKTDPEGRWTVVDHAAAVAWNQETEEWDEIDGETPLKMFDAIMQQVVGEVK